MAQRQPYLLPVVEFTPIYFLIIYGHYNPRAPIGMLWLLIQAHRNYIQRLMVEVFILLFHKIPQTAFRFMQQQH
jgi:hypothetical protein